MPKREQSTGERISSLVFFIAGLWLILEASAHFNQGEKFAGMSGIVGGIASLLAAFRFRIQDFVGRWRK
jgi:predicted Na+-dependent transporter